MSLPPAFLVLLSEGILSLYPILIKILPTNLFTQWFVRFLTFPLLATALSSDKIKDIPSTWGVETIVVGLLNMLHIGSSYLSYSLLPTGIALSLFYLYPITNVLAGSLFFGEKIAVQTIALLSIAFIGVYFLTRTPTIPVPSPSVPSVPSVHSVPSPSVHSVPSPSVHSVPSVPSPTGTQTTEALSTGALSTIGIIAALIAALSETFIYVFVRWSKKASASPLYAIQQLYPVGLLVILATAVLQPSRLDLTPRTIIALLGFNGLLGFTGYIARFYAIPKVTTIIFSLLSFFGVFFGYVWGHLFTEEKTHPIAWIGSALIAFSAFMVRHSHSKDS